MKSISKLFNKLFGLHREVDEKSLQGWREYTFRVMLNVSVIVGAFAYPTMVFTLFKRKEWMVFVVDTIAYCVGIIAVRYIIKEKRYRLRVILFLFIFYMTGISLGLTKATVGDGRLWLLFMAVLAAILLGIRAGSIAVVVSTASWIGIGVLFRSGLINYPYDHLNDLIQLSNFSLWTNTSVIVFAIGAILIGSVTAIFKNLDDSLKESRSLAGKLKQEEEKYHLLFDNSPNLIMEVDRYFKILACNPAMARSLGYQQDELVDKDIRSILPENVLTQREEIATRAFEEGTIQSFQDERGGRYFNTVMVPNPVRGTVQVIANDITDRKYAEEELLDYQNHLQDKIDEKETELRQEMAERERAERTAMAIQKLADLGMLTTGVAHELNSPLQGIQGVTDVLLLDLEETCSDRDFLREQIGFIQESVSRCAKIVKSLRYYAHMSPKDFSEQDLGELIESTLLLAERELEHSNITITTDVAEDMPPMVCNRDQIMRVILNLLTNARDAMPEGGKIEIKADFEAKNRQFKLIVEDTGVGIPKEHKDQVFKPFFTTKPVGKGTGLGMFIVSGIVRAHGGEIKLDSEVGQGTMVKMTFPERPPEDTEPAFFGRYADLM
jgi:PAS domain S-box-containing protein